MNNQYHNCHHPDCHPQAFLLWGAVVPAALGEGVCVAAPLSRAAGVSIAARIGAVPRGTASRCPGLGQPVSLLLPAR